MPKVQAPRANRRPAAKQATRAHASRTNAAATEGQSRDSLKGHRASPEHAEKLERFFAANPYPTTEEKVGLGFEIGWTEKKVTVWFQNRRQRDTRTTARLKSASNASSSSVSSQATSRSNSMTPLTPATSLSATSIETDEPSKVMAEFGSASLPVALRPFFNPIPAATSKSTAFGNTVRMLVVAALETLDAAETLILLKEGTCGP
ncbi:hypothetical protein PUNSTDRAFT_134013 [Punctularia strigosozonata HHB-11173 SS5]|uniref:uncharacterized protein n=1 Tax=Punctularia strigosozonata (strain HHB-11173) TaxID=741275 RepID=UPI0004417DBB|nr:uncharacterized protein PUNSTDRAFT_134013 [Punctularia strigosozonata HHB-11173 SS5]EIN08837.1 hypothetical protein PUNSTDRAFT_134013 [Punctularia strigosozonata HHB-11173 SS5]